MSQAFFRPDENEGQGDTADENLNEMKAVVSNHSDDTEGVSPSIPSTRIEIRVAREEIAEVCTVDFFKATPLNEFRSAVKACLKSNVLLLSSANSARGANEILRYDRHEITKLFTDDIDWKAMCENHDIYQYKKRDTAASHVSGTALLELVAAMTNPTVIPQCCRGRCILNVLFHALLVSPSVSLSLQRHATYRDQHQQEQTTMSSRWTPSQQFLLETIREFATSLANLSDDSFMTSYIQSFVLPSSNTETNGSLPVSSDANSTAATPNKVNRLLSAIYWLLSSSSLSSPLLEVELISSGLLLLRRIDNWNIELDVAMQNRSNATGKRRRSNCCPICNGYIASDNSTTRESANRRRPYSKMRVKNLSSLHDDELEYGTSTSRTPYNNNNPFWHRGYENNPKKVSLKDVLSMKPKKDTGNKSRDKTMCCCGNNIESLKQKQRGSETTTFIPKDWSTVRSRAYKKFVTATVDRQRIRNGSPRKAIAAEESFLFRLVQTATMHIESPSYRVCLALVAHAMGGPKNPCYFQNIARFFWCSYSSSRRRGQGRSAIIASSSLRLYSEWLSECSIFDQRAIVWEAMQPIVRYIQVCIVSQSPDTSGTAEHEGVSSASHLDERNRKYHRIDPSVLACIGWILHKRSPLFQKDLGDEDELCRDVNGSNPQSSIDAEFQSFVNLLSIHCGESSELWLELFSNEARDLVESALQRLGILSFSIVDSRKLGTNARKTEAAPNSESIDSAFVLSVKDWPVSLPLTLRRAMGRVERSVLSLESGNEGVMSLLSSPITDNKIPNLKTKKAEDPKTKASTVPITNYLHDSGILGTIFSFCGPKQLAKIPQVCKAWNSVIGMACNTLWEAAYVSTFGTYRWPNLDLEHRPTLTYGTVPENDKAVTMEKNNWKQLFVRKHIAESLIRFQRNPRSGFKYRTCKYIGCLQILKSVDQERKHDQMHQRLLAKQQAASRKKNTKKQAKTKN